MNNSIKLLVRIQELLNAFGDKHHPLDEPSRRILFEIAEAHYSGNPLIVSDIARNAGYGTAPTIYNRIKGLLRADFIQSRKSPNDGRAVQLMLTPKSQRKLNELGTKIRHACDN